MYADQGTEMKHDDKVGEDVCEEEAHMYQREVIEQVSPCRLRRALPRPCFHAVDHARLALAANAWPLAGAQR
jgi:hypothetical protein